MEPQSSAGRNKLASSSSRWLAKIMLCVFRPPTSKRLHCWQLEGSNCPILAVNVYIYGRNPRKFIDSEPARLLAGLPEFDLEVGWFWFLPKQQTNQLAVLEQDQNRPPSGLSIPWVRLIDLGQPAEFQRGNKFAPVALDAAAAAASVALDCPRRMLAPTKDLRHTNRHLLVHLTREQPTDLCRADNNNRFKSNHREPRRLSDATLDARQQQQQVLSQQQVSLLACLLPGR